MHSLYHSVARYFDCWARDYDTALDAGGYTAPQAMFTAVNPFLPAMGGALLDVGIGTGLSSLPFRNARPDLRIVGVDASPNMLESCRAKGIANTLIRMDVAAGHLPDEPFDAVLACGVLEFMRDPLPLITAAAARLKAGGVLALAQESAGMTPIYQSGLFSGVVERSPDFVAIRRVRARLPWPDVYMKYLHGTDGVIRMGTDLGLRLIDGRCITAYHRAGTGPIAHDLLILQK